MSDKNERLLELLAFGRALRKIRKENKLTQDELSLYSRVDRSYISELENGGKAPSLLTIISLAKALQVKPSLLIERFEIELEDSVQ
ncbi:helix-turn-helix domain-containing protein [Paenibacillus crassostreae]|uniref:DNA-binding protein n=1 Tax=Paenibacillus crassostreae TaxID=1763538 RepID=A0A162KWF6_9BACL|nr:helix-turn-helix transcriptional regulator [Paenibacillus crassostreae]AOZ93292.1 transcriptional regulator [Paenibacillus crassostreae]OAB75063.1 DNA-binding protein [Paenibacillus crassostreae]